MTNLGVLLQDSDPGQARHWYEQAAEAGHTDAMTNLGVLLQDSDPGQARRWYEQAAESRAHRRHVQPGGAALQTVIRARPATGGSRPPRPGTPTP